MSRPASANTFRSTPGMVRMVGPMSNRKPASASWHALPPSHGDASNSTTSYPRPARVQAAASPPSPPPMTPTRLVADFATSVVSVTRVR